MSKSNENLFFQSIIEIFFRFLLIATGQHNIESGEDSVIPYIGDSDLLSSFPFRELHWTSNNTLDVTKIIKGFGRNEIMVSVMDSLCSSVDSCVITGYFLKSLEKIPTLHTFFSTISKNTRHPSDVRPRDVPKKNLGKNIGSSGPT